MRTYANRSDVASEYKYFVSFKTIQVFNVQQIFCCKRLKVIPITEHANIKQCWVCVKINGVIELFHCKELR